MSANKFEGGTFEGNTQFEEFSNDFGKVFKEFIIVIGIYIHPLLENFILKFLVD